MPARVRPVKDKKDRLSMKELREFSDFYEKQKEEKEDKPKLTVADKEKMKSGIYMMNNFLMNMLEIKPDKLGFLRTLDGSKLQIKGRDVKLFSITPESIPFRPVYNSKMMLLLFGVFSQRLQEEEGRYIGGLSYGPAKRKEKNYIEIEEDGYDPLRSEEYYCDSLRFIDAMCKLNESEPPLNMHELDDLMRLK